MMDTAGELPSQKSKKPAAQLSRRGFLDWIIRGGFFTTLAGMLAPALVYLWPVTRGGPVAGLVEVGREEEIPVWGFKKVVYGGSAFLVVRTPREFKAYSAICTHLGCVVTWEETKKAISCPCHAGLFDLEGRVVAGPPPRPLVLHDVSVLDGKVFVKV